MAVYGVFSIICLKWNHVRLVVRIRQKEVVICVLEKEKRAKKSLWKGGAVIKGEERSDGGGKRKSAACGHKSSPPVQKLLTPAGGLACLGVWSCALCCWTEEMDSNTSSRFQPTSLWKKSLFIHSSACVIETGLQLSLKEREKVHMEPQSSDWMFLHLCWLTSHQVLD